MVVRSRAQICLHVHYLRSDRLAAVGRIGGNVWEARLLRQLPEELAIGGLQTAKSEPKRHRLPALDWTAYSSIELPTLGGADKAMLPIGGNPVLHLSRLASYPKAVCGTRSGEIKAYLRFAASQRALIPFALGESTVAQELSATRETVEQN
jgi:hypothetical protein